MTTDDDARDLAIHYVLDRAVDTIGSLRHMRRVDVLLALKTHAPAFDFTFQLLRDQHGVDDTELAERVQAFLENDPEGSALLDIPKAFMVAKKEAAA